MFWIKALSDFKTYLTEPTIKVLISFLTLPVTTSRFFYLYWSGIPFHPKRLKKLSLPFKLHSSWWPNVPITVKWQNYHCIFILNVTADIWNYLFHILFIFTASCFFSSNPVTLWTNDHSLFLSMTASWYQTAISTSLAQPQMYQ